MKRRNGVSWERAMELLQVLTALLLALAALTDAVSQLGSAAGWW